VGRGRRRERGKGIEGLVILVGNAWWRSWGWMNHDYENGLPRRLSMA